MTQCIESESSFTFYNKCLVFYHCVKMPMVGCLKYELIFFKEYVLTITSYYCLCTHEVTYSRQIIKKGDKEKQYQNHS